MTEPGPTTADRVVGRVADVLAGWLYRSVQVRGADSIPPGAVIALVNHGGGFADPVVLVAKSDRMPRFIARDVIWKVPVARSVMAAVQAIPIHRRADSADGKADNTDAFAAVTAALRSGQFVLIFPEGESIDAPRVEHLRTGAARMAVQAHAAGVSPLHVVPIGLHYEDKSTLRSDVYIEVGEPLDIGALLAGLPPEDDRAQVRGLTEEFTAALRSVSPQFQDWAQASDLLDAAGIALRTRDDQDAFVLAETYGEQTQLARLLAGAPRQHLAAVRTAYDAYRDDLSVYGLTDEDVAGRSKLRGRVARRLIESAAAAPIAAATLPANAPGIAVTTAVSRLPIAPPTMATVKPMAAMVAFPVGWTWWALQGGGSWRRKAVRYGAAQVGLAATLVLADRSSALLRAGRAWSVSRHRPADTVLVSRARVLRTVTLAARAATYTAED